ncbi:MAG TPA: 30S ribosomal protein S16 [Patescibacteria group bacterium]|nr:30S ribosomal protein S16 [Patescibacteria group bacterium]
MVRIRLTRTGKSHQPSYRIVVTEQLSKRDGQYIAKLGHYLPTTNPKTIVLDKVAYDAWIKKGAQPTTTVASIVKKYEKSA